MTASGRAGPSSAHGSVDGSKRLPGFVRARRDALGFVLLAAAALALTLYACTPGFMARDSGIQLEQARRFEFWDDHPMVMALLWHYLDRILPGPLGMLVSIGVSYWAGLAGLFWALPGGFVARALGMLAVGFYPPVFAAIPMVAKDGLMQGAILAGLACIVVSARRRRALGAGAGALCFLIAIGVRHNAIAAVWPLLLVPILALPVLAKRSRWLRLGLATALALGLTLSASVGLRAAAAPITHKSEFWQRTLTFDLAAMSIATRRVLVDPKSRVLTRGMGVDQIRHFFNIDYGGGIYYCLPFRGQRCVPVFRMRYDERELERLRQNWLRAVAEHPLAYVRHRLAFARRLLATPGEAKKLYFHDTPPNHPLARAYYPPPPRAAWVMGLIEALRSSIFYAPWLYVCVSLGLGAVGLLFYLRGGSVLPLAYALSGLSYIASDIVGATSSDYRYCIWTILCATLGSASFMALRRSSEGGDSVTQSGRT